MRSLLVCCILLALTASCSQEATSQSASSQSAAADGDTAFQPRMVVQRIREADFRYSLGILLSEKQSHTVPLIRQKLDAALETRFATQTDSPASFVFGEGPFHFANIGGTIVRINSFDTAYFDEEDKFELEALQQAVDKHVAWIAVDVERREGGPTEAGAYRLAGRILEQFVDDNALVIFSATNRTIAVWDDSMREILRGPNPRAVFGDLTGEIIGVGDDPEMEAAIAEARRRMPEFRLAFERRGRGDDSPYLVKAPFEYADGEEHMWVRVTSFAEETLTGILTNEPYYVENIKVGDKVTLPIESITDWMYRKGDETVGGFTIKVLLQRQPPPEAQPAEQEPSNAEAPAEQ
jgi:uncharacterized protein YegJ (DUF2314 family)